jgi:vacuolar protein sorting-associated protein 53
LFDAAREGFISAANLAVRGMVKRVEGEVEMAFREMGETNWGCVESVGDHSGYVNEMVVGIKGGVREITGQGHLRERYVRSLCDRVVEWFGNRFIEAIISCRPICEAGAEQVQHS